MLIVFLFDFSEFWFIITCKHIVKIFHNNDMIEIQTWNFWNVTLILILIMCFHLDIDFGMNFVNENSNKLQKLDV
jgi:hypothetical protein